MQCFIAFQSLLSEPTVSVEAVFSLKLIPIPWFFRKITIHMCQFLFLMVKAVYTSGLSLGIRYCCPSLNTKKRYFIGFVTYLT